MFRNVASQKVQLFAFDTTTGTPKTGDAANITAYVSIDHGSVTVLGDTSATEKDATNAKGVYQFDLTQGETNGDELTFTAKSSTANISITPRFISTNPANFTTQSIDSNGRVDVIKIAGTTQTARDLGTSVLLSSGTGTGQLDFTSGVVKANATQILGTAVSTPATAGILDVNLKNIANAAVSTTTAQIGVNAVNIGGTVQSAGDIFGRVGAATGSPTAQTVSDDLLAVLTRLPTTLVSGRMDVSVGAMAANVITATAIASDAITDAKVASDVTIASVTGTVGSVTGAVGSVTGNVGGNVTGTVGSVVGAVGSVTGNVGGNVVGSVASVTARVTANTDQLAGQTVTAAAGVTFPTSVASPTNITAGTITTVTNLTNAATNGDLTATMKASVNIEADTALNDYDGPTNAELNTALGLADDAVLAQIAFVKAVTDKVNTMMESTGSPTDYVLTARALAQAPTGGGTPPTALDIADAVWDEAIAGHLSAGSTGKSLNDATAAGNPWSAVITGAYTAEDILRIIVAVLAGLDTQTSTGSGTANITFKDIGDSSTIVQASMVNSVRTAVVLSP